MIFGRHMVQGASPVSLNGAAPRCAHLDGLVPVTPRSNGCRDCQAHQDHWVTLLVCLTCGWVACSDDSPNQHAKAHYHETDHPLARSLEPGSSHTWCYVHQRQI